MKTLPDRPPQPPLHRHAAMPAKGAAAVAAVLVAWVALGGAPARAEPPPPPPPPPLGVVNLASSATIEVTKDLLSIVLTTTREGADANVVQAQLKQALDAALTEAKKAARPGQVDVQTGNFALYPRYNGKGVINGWQGSTELQVEGRDMAAIGQLTGRISTLTIARVSYNLSRELRERSEGAVAAEAIARYRAKADDYAKQFGYAGYVVREVNVSTSDPQPNLPMAMARVKTMAAATEDALPVEPGKGTVTASVTGSVQMNR